RSICSDVPYRRALFDGSQVKLPPNRWVNFDLDNGDTPNSIPESTNYHNNFNRLGAGKCGRK
ncbi:MAG TPA: hypothetical protein PLJ27_21630, partial [Polyangiaceae bacterium]|nr:hypothetical protein [Polyangiaceae bacterium]